jgi:ankyrin repeat protein
MTYPLYIFHIKDTDTMRFLITHGRSAQGKDLSSDPCILALSIAIMRGHVDIMRLLIEVSDNLKLGIFQRTTRNVSEFMLSALRSGNLQVVELLREVEVKEDIHPPMKIRP